MAALKRVEVANDYSGRRVEKGDMVILLNDNSSARIADLAKDGDQCFLRLRPLHQPYGKGVWHPADQVIFQSASRKSKLKAKAATH